MAKLKIVGRPRKLKTWVRFDICFADDLIIPGFRYNVVRQRVMGPRKVSAYKVGEHWKQVSRSVVRASDRFKAELLRQCTKRWPND